MKKIWIILVIVLVLGIGVFGVYSITSKNKESKKIEAESELDPDIIKGIFDLATEKCYFANVAEGKKTKKVLLISKSVNYWVEYTETIDIKVDLTKSKFGKKKDNKNTYIIYIPDAEVDEKSASVDENGTKLYLENQSFIAPVDVSSSDIEEAIKESSEKTIKDLKENEDILIKAKERAKEYVKAYFKAVDIKDRFTVEFVDSIEEFDEKAEGDNIYVFETGSTEIETE